MAREVNKALDAEADAFAQLLALSPGDPDGAFRDAATLAKGLFPHQIEGVAFLLGRRRAILADDMGLGKTRQAIVALRHAAPGGPYLVVCPASVKRNWAREIAIAVPHAPTHVIERGTALPETCEWVIVNYDILGKHLETLGTVPWAGLVFDEAHYLKNHRSARSRLARQIADRGTKKIRDAGNADYADRKGSKGRDADHADGADTKGSRGRDADHADGADTKGSRGRDADHADGADTKGSKGRDADHADGADTKGSKGRDADLSTVARNAKVDYADRQEPAIFLLTGTPLTNRPRDLFVLLQLVGHPLGRSFLSFAKRYCAAEKNDYGWETRGASNIEELTVQLHGVMLRRSKDQVLSLPPKIRTWLPVDVPKGTGVRDMRKVVELLIGDDDPAPNSTIDQRRLRGRLLHAVTRARQTLADAKVNATLDFVTGAVEQGEKVIVFSCFEEPVQKLVDAFRGSAVLVTGETPSEKRQGIVDRFQQDDRIRVFVANIIAGGIGHNLTAATQVVFNDLDWVPANHWQAEDRAYRIGQTRTVNVTYMVAADTIDDFVQMVLERKARLVSAIVDGTALAQDLSGDVLDELQRTLRELSSTVARSGQPDQLIERLFQQAKLDLDDDRSRGATARARTAEETEALRRAIETLAKALSSPPVERYRYASASHPGVEYEITVDGADVACTCPGFEYRGQCRHARDVKAAIADGKPAPVGYRST